MTGKKTSPSAASSAARTLTNARATGAEKSAAASALAQSGTNKQTSPRAATAAAKTLTNPRATRAEKTAAGSALAQAAGKAGKK